MQHSTRGNLIKTVLVAVDLKATTDHTLDHAARLAKRHDASLCVLHVVEWLESWWSPMKLQSEYLDSLRKDGLQHLRDSLSRCSDPPAEVEFRVEFGTAWQVILQIAEPGSTELVVLGTRGRHGAQKRLLGSTAERVLARTQVPVLAIPPGESALPETPSRILVPTDLSLDFETPLRTALRVSGTAPAPMIYLLHAVDLPRRYRVHVESWEEYTRGALETIREHINEGAEELEANGIQTTPIVEVGHSADMILQVAETESVDLIALSTRGGVPRGPLHFGSTARRVVRDAQCPILLTVPEEQSAAEPPNQKRDS